MASPVHTVDWKSTLSFLTALPNPGFLVFEAGEKLLQLPSGFST
jgi:hypothetical protein